MGRSSSLTQQFARPTSLFPCRFHSPVAMLFDRLHPSSSKICETSDKEQGWVQILAHAGLDGAFLKTPTTFSAPSRGGSALAIAPTIHASSLPCPNSSTGICYLFGPGEEHLAPRKDIAEILSTRLTKFALVPQLGGYGEQTKKRNCRFRSANTDSCSHYTWHQTLGARRRRSDQSDSACRPEISLLSPAPGA